MAKLKDYLNYQLPLIDWIKMRMEIIMEYDYLDIYDSDTPMKELNDNDMFEHFNTFDTSEFSTGLGKQLLQKANDMDTFSEASFMFLDRKDNITFSPIENIDHRFAKEPIIIKIMVIINPKNEMYQKVMEYGLHKNLDELKTQKKQIDEEIRN